jgi:hypothetical protein
MRKRENERIERENHAFAKRLFQNSGMIRKTDMDKFYEQSQLHKNRIRRVKKTLPGLNNTNKLAPLDDSVFKKTKRSAYSIPRQGETDNEKMGSGRDESSPSNYQSVNEKSKYQLPKNGFKQHGSFSG